MCSYVFWDFKCSRVTINKNIGLCEFHADVNDKTISNTDFQKEIDLILKSDLINFVGFVFPKECSEFASIEFVNDAYFRDAKFEGKSNFNRVIFKKDAFLCNTF